MVTSIWEPCTLSNKCRRLNIYLMTSSLFRMIRVTRYLGLLRKLSLHNNVSLPCSTKGFCFLAPFCLRKDVSMVFFRSQENVATVRSMSITVRLDISVWQPSSVLRSASSSPQTCLPPDCLAWLYGCFFGLYWSQILLQIANILIIFLPNEIFLVLLKRESRVNYRACQFKLLGMPEAGRNEWWVPPQGCVNASKLNGLYCVFGTDLLSFASLPWEGRERILSVHWAF